MGCCASREASSDAPVAVERGYNSSRADSPVNDAEAALEASAQTSLVRHPNATLRKPKAWRSTSRTWSRAQLSRERDIFWETQVTGQREVWSAVRLAVEMVRNDNDLKGAKAVLDASGCTCPTGRMAEGVWDERGVLYRLPKWVVIDPINTIESTADEEQGHNVDDDGAEEDDDDDDEDEEAKDNVHADEDNHSKDEKGKGRLPVGPNAVIVKARLSDRATDVELVVDNEAPIRALIKRVQAEAGIPSKTKVKIAYLGKVLKDNESLAKQGWQQGHVLNALVFQ